jgi:hypothetical protein
MTAHLRDNAMTEVARAAIAFSPTERLTPSQLSPPIEGCRERYAVLLEGCHEAGHHSHVELQLVR